MFYFNENYIEKVIIGKFKDYQYFYFVVIVLYLRLIFISFLEIQVKYIVCFFVIVICDSKSMEKINFLFIRKNSIVNQGLFSYVQGQVRKNYMSEDSLWIVGKFID